MSDDVDKPWQNIARSPREEARKTRIRLMKPDGKETGQSHYIKLFARAEELAASPSIIPEMVDEAIASATRMHPDIASKDNSNEVIAKTVTITLEQNFGPATLAGINNQQRLLSDRANSNTDSLPNF